jgi:hypothetical protein
VTLKDACTFKGTRRHSRKFCSMNSAQFGSALKEIVAMAKAKHASKRKRRSKAVPVLGAAGLLSLAGGSSSAQTIGHAIDLPTRGADASHQLMLSDEEVSDVSLATFYVFDKENTASGRPGLQLTRGGCGGCGGRGCGCGGCGGRGCGCLRGCGGCGGCAALGLGIGLGLLGLAIGGCGGCGGYYYGGCGGGYYYGGCGGGYYYGGCGGGCY